MHTPLRTLMLHIIAIAVAPLAFGQSCCQPGDLAQKDLIGGESSCCDRHDGRHDTCEPVQWADAASVQWVNKGVSFGNYMKMAVAEIPPAAAAPPVIGPIFFDFDKSFLRPESVQVCNQLVQYLKANPGQHVRIEGNSCDIGTNAYNKKLGARRAAAVKKFLVEHGIAGSRIKTVSYGEERPKYGTEQRRLNRRDDIVIQIQGAPQ